MTAAGHLLAAGIGAQGPILFSRFMEVALYHPEHGYYRRARREQGADPFGMHGDFYTATQLQPVFGRLIAAQCAHWQQQLGAGEAFHVVEWGAGRGEMAEHLSSFRYSAVDVDGGEVPAAFEGVIFCNELFDALPVEAVRVCRREARMMRVGLSDGRFVWVEGEPLTGPWLPYAVNLCARIAEIREEEEVWLELPVGLESLLARMTRPLTRGFVLAIDYGYTEREIIRFPRGTLMAYRRHQALDDVLLNPGEQDITAHVPFTHLEHCAQALGLLTTPLRSLTQLLMSAGEADQFAGALAAPDDAAALRLRMQLKSLLFGLGETFRCLVMEKRSG
ncbi:SAM-dependent methyltransferase [Paludibaculum fermentans]|uniref:SAM-dependent methyltransferase n=1 Tax=Paludibaculum fermentans TaxID=1473598 RepID=A0A7S7NM31_PALFE|nr:SAM-dependent methyltransferase [Paludibaculum fermentans]QOY86098.1 SAM-dependent methyltransferase [Paludibaculum fermentans]